MEHTALYRKYRPSGFSDIIGQDHIVEVLKAAIKSENIAHAYLFAGSRGTGKTSIARILARELGTTDNDMYEIDAASNNGVDDIRELRENVRSLPFDSKYKVYILDEVHMLSKAAFNALLKTLEEPPSHVIFILATTELDKVPETILSRCQTFAFKKPNQETLAALASTVAKKEGFTLEEGAAGLIAILGDGSFRDTQGILQKVLTYSKDKKISLEEVARVTGAPAQTLVQDYVRAIAEKNIAHGLAATAQAASQNIDSRVFLKLILHLFRLALLVRVAPDVRKSMKGEYAESDLVFVDEILATKPATITSASLAILLESYSQTRQTPIAGLPLEVALLRVIGEEIV